ncbi:hypothetical protein GCM10029976_008800 [Kribbella albertanoniae]|uniref:Prokaryotic metallothionein n=1 Tax=Kribbella albertanoniae TaxID=1266829 RepID=A0A4R4P5L8_9ACTN|nr:hypothetical protein [Kribbella albertanoniae]TDC17728.1 hypothetical protein E1261_36500 [Kribbella albertanoniae]
MPSCDVCGNDYANAFFVRTAAGEELTFDSIECAAHRIAPTCTHCGCRILGHGTQADTATYCCAHCAREHGVTGIQDRAK